jgi:spore coat polysaccharide biosynthesis protein SpsF
MKNVAIIQARLGSTRLPAKVLRDIQGQTMLKRVVRRIRQCKYIDQVVVATSDETVDEPLVKFCQDEGFDVFLGSHLDVLMADPFLDYSCNFFPVRRFPRGLDAEAFTLDTLLKANEMAFDAPEREHVTLQIYRNPSLYKIGSVQTPEDHSSLRWTVDTMDDLRLINSIYRHFGTRRFRWRDVVDAYEENPHWLTINQNITQQRVA